MSKPRPLTPQQARNSLAHRFGRRADSLRQLATRFGIRPDRVFLVWTRWSGARRGEGDETVTHRVEILPTPRVSDVTSLARRPWSVGILPEGTLRVDRISVYFTEDHLSGLVIPSSPPTVIPSGEQVAGTPVEPREDPQRDFFWEIAEDGRGDALPDRRRFRLFAKPNRAAGSVEWAALLEPVSEPVNREGKPRVSEEDALDEDVDE